MGKEKSILEDASLVTFVYLLKAKFTQSNLRGDLSLVQPLPPKQSEAIFLVMCGPFYE
jgi:hypothetical protein